MSFDESEFLKGCETRSIYYTNIVAIIHGGLIVKKKGKLIHLWYAAFLTP
jgi:hypothetical protein